MKKLSINLKNCYGINSLKYELDFSNKNVFSIYASNGTMKTSFAKTFLDLSKERDSKDEIYTERKTIREIKVDEHEDLSADKLLVVKPYDEEYQSDKIYLLLVNKDLKKQYDTEYQKIGELKESFLTNIKELAGLHEREIENEICKIFFQDEKEKFFEALETREKQVLNDEDPLHADVRYSDLFNDRTKDIIKNKDFLKNIEKYVEKYNELLENSNFFKKGIFNHIQAEDIATQLDKNGFFKAGHSVFLKGIEEQVKGKDELVKVINDEKNKILKDEELKKLFNLLDKHLKRNQDIRNFRDYLSNNPQIIAEFSNVESFKAKLWISYFKKNKENFKILLSTYNQSQKTLEKIRKKARKEKNLWDKVIEEFNNKFFVPFKLFIPNQVGVTLDEVPPEVSFKFEEKEVEKLRLLEVLSQGEKRALYILNILFEVEARKENENDCLFIIDDIADSFDYKNKYAIIEYLNEISKEEKFYMVVLTHNFDFHRSLSSRLDMERKNKLTISKLNNEIKFNEEFYQNDPINHWRENFSKTEILLASIPMVRNLFEYSGKKAEYQSITNFLHIKKNTKELKIKDLETLYKKIFSNEKTEFNKDIQDKKYYDLLLEKCGNITEQENKLEHKIILSIAIRLLTEDFIMQKLNNNLIRENTPNQTFVLYEKYKEKFSSDETNIKLFERVNLMTPQNIHFNSFMYEPILDMGIDELKKLYQDVKKLAIPCSPQLPSQKKSLTNL